MKSKEQISNIQFICDELSQWITIYNAIDPNNKKIKELGYEKLEVYCKRLKELV